MNIGIAGISAGNGHPYSFSAIINGFDKKKFSTAGWPTIYDYLISEPSSQHGIPEAEVTHGWTQDLATTKNLCNATKIKVECTNMDQMIGEIDALIIARDDWESHINIAKPFLEVGTPVFIDKPLTLSKDELSYFLPFLESGKLMSCSGFRYSSEILESRDKLSALGQLKLISGVTLNSLIKYGIHLLQPIIALLDTLPTSIIVSRNYAQYESYSFQFQSGLVVKLDCLGDVSKVFNLNFFGENGKAQVELSNNFRAFKTTIENFLKMIETGEPPFNPRETIIVIGILQVAYNLKEGETKLVKFSHSNYEAILV